MNIKLNNGVKRAIELIEENNGEAYLVGGALRDYILGYVPNDFDLATSLSLTDLNLIFKDYHPKLYSRGETISCHVLGTYLEITPFKGATIEDDLSNRDFTINAMAYNDSLGLIDPFNGEADLENNILRVVKPYQSIKSDPLRILRGLRFSASKGFNIEDGTKNEFKHYAYLLADIKTERIKSELDPIMISERPSLYISEYPEVFFEIFPALRDCYKFDQRNKKWHHLDVFSHIMAVLDSTRNNIVLRYAALLHDIMKPACFTMDADGIGHFYGHEMKSATYAYQRLKELHYSMDFIKRVSRIIYYHDYQIANNEKSMLKFIYRFGTDDLDLFFALKRADIMGQNPSLIDRIYEIDKITEGIRNILKADKIITFKNLKIGGRELLELGYEPRLIGDALEIILRQVRNKQIKNEKNALYEYARRLKYDMRNEN